MLAEYIFILTSLWLRVHTVNVCNWGSTSKAQVVGTAVKCPVLSPPLPPHLLPSRGWGKNVSCRGAASVALKSLLYRCKRTVYDMSLNTEGILQPLGTRRMEPDSPKGAGREGEVQSHPFVTTVCPLLFSDDCSNPPGWVNVHHACEGDHVTIAVPSPTSAAPLTGRA